MLLLNKLTASLAVHAASLAQEAPTEPSSKEPVQLQCKVERPVSGAGLAERLSQVCMALAFTMPSLSL